MENSKNLYRQFNEQRLIDKSAPNVDMFKVMDNLKKSVDFYNSFGISKASSNNKKPLGEANK
jgi:hypothetical protein